MKRLAKRAVLAATVAMALVPDLGRAAAITWTGGGANSNVSTVLNWVNGATHVAPGAADDAHFAGMVDLTPNVDASDSWLDIFFDAGAGAFTVGPLSLGSTTNILTLGNTTPSGGNITNNSTSTETINVDVKPRTGTVSATAGNLVLNGVFWAGNTPNRGQSGRFNTFAGAFNIYLNGPTTYGGGLVINGPGTVFMTNNANENNGEITVNNGSLQINVPNALGLEPGVTTTTTYATATAIGGGSVTGDTTAFTLINGGADTGVLKLSDTNPNTSVAAGSVTFAPEPLQFQARTTSAAQLDNVSGNNIWQGTITFTALAGSSNYGIQSDAGTLTLATTANITGVNGTQVLNLEGASNGVINSVISTPAGTLGITKSGAGTWTLNGANTFTGPTIISGGSLVVGASGSIANSSSFTLTNNSTLDVSATSGLALSATQTLSAAGTVKGSVSDSVGTQIIPGGTGTAGTLAVTSNLSLAGGDTLQFDLSSNSASGNDQINVGGNLALGGTTTLNLNLLNNVLGSGTYDLINYTTESGSGTFALAGGGASGSTRQTIGFTNSGGQVDLVVTGQSANLTWTGGLNGNTWDLKTTKNFFNNGTSGSDFYYDLDAVTFDNSGNAASPVTLAGVLTPASVAVNSSQNYTFAGTGSLNGSMALTKSGSGMLTILTTNTYSGGTIINSGVVQVGNGTVGGSLGTGPITDNGSLIFNPPGTVAVPGNIGGNGTITKQGSGEVDLTGASSYSGGTTISAGTLGAGGSTPLGTNGGGTSIAAGARLLTLSAINIPGTITLSGNYDGAAGHGAIEASGGTSTAGVTATVANLNMTGSTTLAADQFSALVVSGVITGTGSNMSIVGGGTIDFTGTNTYDGTTSVASGVILQPNNPSALGTIANGTTVAAGGELYATIAETLAEPFTVAGFGVGGTAAAPTTGAIRTGGATTVTYSAPINLSADAGFYVDGGATMAVTGNVTGSNTNLTLSGAVSSTGSITGNLSLGTGGITVATAGNWILAGADSFTGPTTVNTGATLTVGNAGTAGSIATSSSVTDNGVIAYNLTSAYAESHNITGTGGITQSGTGTTTLSGTNGFSGPVIVSAGELQATNSSSLGTSSGVTITGNGSTAILNMAGGVTLAAPITMDGRALTATNTVPVEITSDGSNTLTGAIALQTGGNAYGFQSNSGLLTVSGTMTNSTGSATERYVYLGGAGNGLINGANAFAIGTATGGAGIGLVKDGAGTWTVQLQNPNSLTGDVIIKQGTLAMQGYGPMGQGVLGATNLSQSIVTTITVYSGATYDLTGYADVNGGSTSPGMQVLQGLAGSGSVLLASGEQLRAFADNTISPGISGAPGTLSINGGLHLSTDGDSGDPAGPEPLGTTLAFGLGATPSGSNDSLSVAGTIDTDDICNVTITPLAGTMSGTYTLVNAGNITSAVQSDLQINNTTRYNMTLNTTSTQVKVTISGSTGSDTWAGTAGTWDVKTTQAWTGTPNGDNLFWTADAVNFTDAGAAQPTVTINTPVAPSAVNFTANSTNYTFTGTGKITGGAVVNKSGTGMLTISTANDYSGVTSITNGVLQVGNAAALGSSAGDTEVSGTGTLDVNNFSLGAEAVTISGNGFNGEGAMVNNGTGTDNSGGGTAWATQHLTLTGDASIGGTARWDLRDSAAGANDAFLVGNGHNLTMVGTNQIWLVGAQISNLNSITINSGEIGLQDAVFTNTSGNTTVTTNTGSTLGLWSDSTAGQTLTLNWVFNGATTLSSSNDPTTMAGPISVTGASAWNINVPTTIAGSITGTGTITTSSTGVFTLQATNNFGGLTVSAGTTTVTGNTTVGQLLGSAASTLNITGGTLVASAQAHATATFTAVSITGGGTLDIGNGALVIPYTTTDPMNTILGYLESSYDKGAWDKPGLTSSATHSARGTTLGYLDTGTQVEVKFTWYGDLDFSGVVDAADLAAMNAGNGSSWAKGDLNFDGVKNADDYSLFMLGAAMQNGSIPAGVPEPSAALLILALPVLGLRRRLRRD